LLGERRARGEEDVSGEERSERRRAGGPAFSECSSLFRGGTTERKGKGEDEKAIKASERKRKGGTEEDHVDNGR